MTSQSDSIAIPFRQVAVSIDAAVAQERPDAADMLAALQVDLGHQEGFFTTGFGDELALRAQHVAVAPELDARCAERRRLVADTVAAQHRQTVGDGMTAVAQYPGIALAVLFGLFGVRIPADRGGLQQQVLSLLHI